MVTITNAFGKLHSATSVSARGFRTCGFSYFGRRHLILLRL
jgi:hypothetical protein